MISLNLPALLLITDSNEGFLDVKLYLFVLRIFYLLSK